MEFVISHKTKVAQMSPDMKITQVKSNGKSLKNIELPDVMTAIRSGEQARVVNEHRGILSSSMPGDRNIHATDILFCFCRPVQEERKQDRVSGV